MAAKNSVADNVEAFAPRVRAGRPQAQRVRVAFRSGESTFYPFLDEVIWIQARRNYSQVNLRGASFTVREILASLERRLAQYGFFRVQRSAIINLDHVVEIRRERRGHYAVLLSDGSSVAAPTAVKDRIEQLLTDWSS
ncbi:MAG: LytR/AlgR family response regulator transcription factor [Thermoanaerobaculia bacterium]